MPQLPRALAGASARTTDAGPGAQEPAGGPALRLRRAAQSSPAQLQPADGSHAGDAPDMAQAAPAPPAGEGASAEHGDVSVSRSTATSLTTGGDSLARSVSAPAEVVPPASFAAAPGGLALARDRRAVDGARQSVPLAAQRSLRATRPALRATGSGDGVAQERTMTRTASALGSSVQRAVPAVNAAAHAANATARAATATPSPSLGRPGPESALAGSSPAPDLHVASRPAAAGVSAGSPPATRDDAPLVLRSAPPGSSAKDGPAAAGLPETPVAVQSQAAEPVDSVAPATGDQTGPASSAAAATPTGLGEREMEELLRRLYPKLRIQLARELLVARERAGLLTDLH